MRGYTEKEVLTQREVRLFHLAGLAVAHVHEGLDPREGGVRCHELARAVGRQLELTVVDGKYASVDHSWLVTVDGKDYSVTALDTRLRPKILDVYCVARMPQVQIIDPHPFVGHWKLYKRCAPRKDIRADVLTKLNELLDEKFRPEMERLQRGAALIDRA